MEGSNLLNQDYEGESNGFRTPPSRPARQSYDIKSPPAPRRLIQKEPNSGRINSISFQHSLRTTLFPANDVRYDQIGQPELKIFRLTLPSHLVARFGPLIEAAESFASTTQRGWKTNLYSLTQQDIPVLAIAGGLAITAPITEFVMQQISRLYGSSSIRMDSNQPHILKYDHQHQGVRLHHDYCCVTANLVLNNSFVGGGTFIPAANTVVRLNVGEVLLHPGSLVHSGLDITEGMRYLLVYFCHIS